MSEPSVPDGFEPPRGLVGDGFRLRPESSWPRPLGLEENLGDLERHARDFAERTGFTYTVLDSDDDVIGCVYVYPARDDVHVQSWVRESRAELNIPLRSAVARLAGRRVAVRAAALRPVARLTLRRRLREGVARRRAWQLVPTGGNLFPELLLQ